MLSLAIPKHFHIFRLRHLSPTPTLSTFLICDYHTVVIVIVFIHIFVLNKSILPETRSFIQFVQFQYKIVNLMIWMDEWPAMETDAGRAVMKTPATKTKALF